MMDITSLQSIEEQLIPAPVRASIQKTEYMQNLKSECYFKQNALKTAENLIEEYHRQNQQLKLQILRLNLKIQNYEERIQTLRHQVQFKQSSNAKTYQKQLFKSSHKLSKALQKYSELQEKYHTLEKELTKYKFYKQQNEQRILHENNKNQKALKIQIEKQFDNFLRTPINKSSAFKTNPSTSKKQYAPKHNNFINLKLTDFQSESNDHDQTQYFHQNSADSTKGHIQIGDDLFDRKPSVKKSAEKIDRMHKKCVKGKQKQIQNEEEGMISQKLRILEWKLKEKDEQVMLMLRRNKEIQMKYNLLKQIIQDKKPINQTADNYDILEGKEKDFIKQRRIDSLKTNQTLKSNRHFETEDRKDDRNSEQQKLENRKISHFNTSLNDSTSNTRWKNYKTFKYN